MEIYIRNKALKGVFDIEQYCKDNDIDVEEVTELYCHYNELTELKGLDKLVNLKELDCVENKLTELDLSKLVNLKLLDCNFNELTELDVSKLVNLKVLSCNNNELTELKGLDKLVNLKELSCNNNELTELKGLDKLANLQWLNGAVHTQPISGQIKQIIDKMDIIIDKMDSLLKINKS